MARKSRVVLLAIWAIIALVIFYSYQGNKQADLEKYLTTIKALKDDGSVGSDLVSGDKLEPPAVVDNSLSKDKTNEALTKEEGQVFNPKTEYEAILGQGPVVIFSKSYCPYSKAAKDILLTQYQIIPTPVVVELDLHPHGPELQQYIAEVTGRKTVPNVHVNGITKGGGDEFHALVVTDKLISEMKAWGNSKFSITKNVKPE